MTVLKCFTVESMLWESVFWKFNKLISTVAVTESQSALL